MPRLTSKRHWADLLHLHQWSFLPLLQGVKDLLLLPNVTVLVETPQRVQVLFYPSWTHHALHLSAEQALSLLRSSLPP